MAEPENEQKIDEACSNSMGDTVIKSENNTHTDSNGTDKCDKTRQESDDDDKTRQESDDDDKTRQESDGDDKTRQEYDDDDSFMSSIRPDGRFSEINDRSVNANMLKIEPNNTQIGQDNATSPNIKSNDVNGLEEDTKTTGNCGLTNESSNGCALLSPIEIISSYENIENLEVDIIVSSDDSTLHSRGLVASTIAKKGGHMLDVSKDCVRYMCKHITNWTFQPTTAAGKLKCKHIFHVVVPLFSKQKQDESRWMEAFKSLIFDIITRADHMGYVSIAMPLIGTGRNGAPVDLVIDLICKSIEHFVLEENICGFLKSVIIVHPDRKVKQTIDEKIASLRHYSKPTKTGKKDEKSKINHKSYFHDFTDRKKKDTCPICMDEISSSKLKQLSKCKHVFCKNCLKMCFERTPACPVCNMVYGEIIGNQPDGLMVETFQRDTHLPGFKDCGTIQIFYSFLDGIQSDGHSNPGRSYKGTKRAAYLPDNKEGQKVHRLLRKAFNQRLLFTVGSSRTTGKEDVVTWNDVHHKTNMTGGPAKYGYPDPDYLSRVLDELSAKGITEEYI